LEPYLNICSSESSLAHFLKKLAEFGEFDQYVKLFIEVCLKKRIIRLPSKGPYGEQGKDIVFVSNDSDNSFTSFVIKTGNLDKNLDGPFGILRQMDEAMFIELEEPEFKNKKRTVIVIYNGEDGYRGAVEKFEKKREEIHHKAESLELLLRKIERWDVYKFAQLVFPHCDKLQETFYVKNKINQLTETHNLLIKIDRRFSNLKIDEEKSLTSAERLIVDLIREKGEIERKFGPLQKIKRQSEDNDK